MKVFIRPCNSKSHGISMELWRHLFMNKIISVDDNDITPDGWMINIKENIVLNDKTYKLLKSMGIKESNV